MRCWRSAHGFTVVELIVTTGLVCLLAGTLLTLTRPAQEFLSVQPEAQDLQQRLRVSAAALQRRLEHAGAGPAAGALTGPLLQYVAAVYPYRLGERRPDAPAVLYRTDALSLLHVPLAAASARIRSVTPAGDVAYVEVEPNCVEPSSEPCGFADAERVIVFDRAGRAWVGTVTDVNGFVITVASSWIDVGVDLSAAVMVPVELSVYSLGIDRATGASRLMRYDGRLTELPVADHVIGLQFEYFVDPVPPLMIEENDPPTYGPIPPPWDVDRSRDAWPPGENCTFLVEAERHRPRLAALESGGQLVQAAGALFTDGPWCPDALAPNRFDADLFRVRRIDVVIRVQAALRQFRGRDPLRFRNPGVAIPVAQGVPDQDIRFSVSPDSLRPARSGS
jgi:type II secretory pathway pseudopilin PulG